MASRSRPLSCDSVFARRADGLVDRRQHAARVLEEDHAVVRERDAVNAPLEEGAAGNLLELPDRDGDGALRDVQFTRRPGDLSRAGRRHEVADLAQ